MQRLMKNLYWRWNQSSDGSLFKQQCDCPLGVFLLYNFLECSTECYYCPLGVLPLQYNRFSCIARQFHRRFEEPFWYLQWGGDPSLDVLIKLMLRTISQVYEAQIGDLCKNDISTRQFIRRQVFIETFQNKVTGDLQVVNTDWEARSPRGFSWFLGNSRAHSSVLRPVHAGVCHWLQPDWGGVSAIKISNLLIFSPDFETKEAEHEHKEYVEIVNGSSVMIYSRYP